MAHLAIGDFENDSSTAFLQEFYQCLAVLSDDLFFARYKAEPKDFEKGNFFVDSFLLESNVVVRPKTLRSQPRTLKLFRGQGQELHKSGLETKYIVENYITA